MSFPTFGTTVPAYFLGRPRRVYEARYGQPAAATIGTVTTLHRETQVEALRLRAVA